MEGGQGGELCMKGAGRRTGACTALSLHRPGGRWFDVPLLKLFASFLQELKKVTPTGRWAGDSLSRSDKYCVHAICSEPTSQ